MTSRMHVAVYHNLHSGGALRTLVEQVRRLDSSHHLTLFTPETATAPELNGVERRVFPFQTAPHLRRPILGRVNRVLRSADLLRLERVNRTIARAIDEGGFDVVLVHPCQFTQAPALLRHLETPAVYYCHEPPRSLYEPVISRPYHAHSRRRRLLDCVDPARSLYRSLLQRGDREATRAASRVLVNSAYTRENVRHIYSVEAVICRHGIDTRLFRPLGLEREGFVLSVGALTPLKGFDTLIEGLAALPAYKRPPLCLIGNYTESQEWVYLKHLAGEHRVCVNVRLQVSDVELVEAYNRASLVAYTPHREPLGLVPLESMACGTAVVGVREGGVQETVRDGETGLLADRRPEDVARALGELMDDPALARRLGEEGRRTVEAEWDWPHAIRSLEGHLAAVA